MKKMFLFCLLLGIIFSGYGQQAGLPLIGISGTFGENKSSSVPGTYVRSVLRAGGVPVILPINDNPDVIEKMISSVDILLMTGGEDIDPLKWYGEEPLRNLESVVPERDAFDMMLLKAAIKRGIPVLAVCRGMQLMNIAYGGTLYQDIPTQVKESFVKHRQEISGQYATHSIIIEKNSLLFQLLGTEKAVVNSFHHQSVKDVAPGFKVTARAADGIIEAMEMENNPNIIAVQFHPESLTAAGNDTFLPVFHYLMKQALKQ